MSDSELNLDLAGKFYKDRPSNKSFIAGCDKKKILAHDFVLPWGCPALTFHDRHVYDLTDFDLSVAHQCILYMYTKEFVEPANLAEAVLVLGCASRLQITNLLRSVEHHIFTKYFDTIPKTHELFEELMCKALRDGYKDLKSRHNHHSEDEWVKNTLKRYIAVIGKMTMNKLGREKLFKILSREPGFYEEVVGLMIDILADGLKIRTDGGLDVMKMFGGTENWWKVA